MVREDHVDLCESLICLLYSGRAVFDPQGHTIATVEEASVVFYGVEGRIRCVCFNRLTIVEHRRVTHLCSVLKTGRRGENNITKMCISHDGGFLATSHINGKLRVSSTRSLLLLTDIQVLLRSGTFRTRS